MSLFGYLRKIRKPTFFIFIDGEHEILRTGGQKLIAPSFAVYPESAIYNSTDSGIISNKYIECEVNNSISVPFSKAVNGISIVMVTAVTTAGTNTLFTLKKKVNSSFLRQRVKSFASAYSSKKYAEQVAYTADNQDLVTGPSSGYDFKYTITSDGSKLIVPTAEVSSGRSIYFSMKVKY